MLPQPRTRVTTSGGTGGPALRFLGQMQELWDIERRLWLEGVEAFAAHMDPACVMAFPPPAGVMHGPAILDSLRDAPRWTELDLSETHFARPAEDCAVLAYRAAARRASEDAYRAYCTSTYVRKAGGWRLVQHQQTPL